MSSKPKRLDECSVNQMTVDLISKGCQGISQYKARGTSLKKGYQPKWPLETATNFLYNSDQGRQVLTTM